jgi:hypothetical protein
VKFFLVFFFIMLSNDLLASDIEDVMGHCTTTKVAGKVLDVTNDEFIIDFIEKISWNVVKENLSGVQVVKSKVDSPHSGSASNYVISAEKGESFVSYYLGNGNDFPLCTLIKSEEIDVLLGRNFERSYEYFKNKLNIQDGFSVVNVDSLEGDSSIELYFSEGELMSVMYKSSYVD